jgi:Ca2+-binding RTX toxin-like protein
MLKEYMDNLNISTKDYVTKLNDIKFILEYVLDQNAIDYYGNKYIELQQQYLELNYDLSSHVLNRVFFLRQHHDGRPFMYYEENDLALTYKDMLANYKLSMDDRRSVFNYLYQYINILRDHPAEYNKFIKDLNHYNINSVYESQYELYHEDNNEISAIVNNNVSIVAYDNDNTIKALKGNNNIYTGVGDDKVYTGNGDDLVILSTGNDYTETKEGNDYIDGGLGNDYIDAGDGDDTLVGSYNDDTLKGGKGNDLYIIYSGDGNDIIEDQFGNNLIQYRELTKQDLSLIIFDGLNVKLVFNKTNTSTEIRGMLKLDAQNNLVLNSEASYQFRFNKVYCSFAEAIQTCQVQIVDNNYSYNIPQWGFQYNLVNQAGAPELPSTELPSLETKPEDSESVQPEVPETPIVELPATETPSTEESLTPNTPSIEAPSDDLENNNESEVAQPEVPSESEVIGGSDLPSTENPINEIPESSTSEEPENSLEAPSIDLETKPETAPNLPEEEGSSTETPPSLETNPEEPSSETPKEDIPGTDLPIIAEPEEPNHELEATQPEVPELTKPEIPETPIVELPSEETPIVVQPDAPKEEVPSTEVPELSEENPSLETKPEAPSSELELTKPEDSESVQPEVPSASEQVPNPEELPSIEDVINPSPSNDPNLSNDPSLEDLINNALNDRVYTNIINNQTNLTVVGTNENDNITANDRNNTVYAHNGNDYIDAGIGNDFMYGENGDDIIMAGVGNDYLNGGNGNDIFIYNPGDGKDIISDNNKQGDMNIIKLNDIHYTDVTIMLVGSSVKIISNEQDQLTIYRMATTDQNYIIMFADQTLTTQELLQTITGTNNAEIITSVTDNTTINGLSGNDTLVIGTNFKGTLNGDDGNDILHGNVQSDNLNGGNGRDTIFGNNGNDIINGDNDNDTLYGGNGDDNIDGGAGKDNLYGENGNDILNGGDDDQSNDTLNGGNGSDAYYYTSKGGKDIISDNNRDLNKVILKDLNTNDVTVIKSGTNIILQVDANNSLTINRLATTDTNYLFQFKDQTITAQTILDTVKQDGVISANTNDTDYNNDNNTAVDANDNTDTSIDAAINLNFKYVSMPDIKLPESNALDINDVNNQSDSTTAHETSHTNDYTHLSLNLSDLFSDNTHNSEVTNTNQFTEINNQVEDHNNTVNNNEVSTNNNTESCNTNIQILDLLQSPQTITDINNSYIDNHNSYDYLANFDDQTITLNKEMEWVSLF